MGKALRTPGATPHCSTDGQSSHKYIQMNYAVQLAKGTNQQIEYDGFKSKMETTQDLLKEVQFMKSEID